MRNLEIFVAPTEFKFVGDAQPGEFEGYGAIFNKLDSHKDVIAPGAFTESLAEHKAKGTLPGLYVEHSAFVGGDPLPVGVYSEMSQDNHGLKVKGKISALDTDHGRRIRGLMQDGALSGLSIAYTVPPGGAIMGKSQGEPRRKLIKVLLHAIDIVRDPSNSAARIQELKSSFMHRLKSTDSVSTVDPDGDDDFDPDVDGAVNSLASAIGMQDNVLMNHLQDAHAALTGDRVPDGVTGWTKSATIGGIRTILVKELGLSRKRADDVAKLLFGSLPRDEGSNQANHVGTKDAVKALSAQLADFSLTK
jgi:HK97 family phage prohead protease